jgi:hypothetical protein
MTEKKTMMEKIFLLTGLKISPFMKLIILTKIGMPRENNSKTRVLKLQENLLDQRLEMSFPSSSFLSSFLVFFPEILMELLVFFPADSE